MKPNPMFEYFRADEVAECWEGVPSDLYAKLWNVIVPRQKDIPNIEDSGPHDHVGHESLASHWELLNEDEQKILNDLADAKDREFEEWNKQWER